MCVHTIQAQALLPSAITLSLLSPTLHQFPFAVSKSTSLLRLALLHCLLPLRITVTLHTYMHPKPFLAQPHRSWGVRPGKTLLPGRFVSNHSTSHWISEEHLFAWFSTKASFCLSSVLCPGESWVINGHINTHACAYPSSRSTQSHI